MKIVIAAWHVRDFNVGIGRYTRNLLEGIGRVDHENQYVILTPDAYRPLVSPPNFRYRRVRLSNFKKRYWEQVAPLLVGPYDLLHFPFDSCVAIKRGKLVTTIHDVKPLLLSDGKRPWPWKGMFKRMMIPNPLEKIDHVVTISQCSKRDIMEKLGVPDNRISVIYQGVEFDRFCPNPSGNSERPDAPSYILCVAGSDPTKNIKSLIHAYSKFPNRLLNNYQLVLAGDLQRDRMLCETIKQLGLENNVVMTGIVSDERLVRLYQEAAVFVFPSLYEGFGLPLLEAMACGCPVVSSNRSSIPEVVGDAGILIDPLDLTAMSQAIERVLTDSTLAERLRGAGLRQAKRFDWNQTARETVQLYQKVVGADPTS